MKNVRTLEEKNGSKNRLEATWIVVADDHGLARAGVLHTLATEPDLKVVGEARDGEEAVSLCRRLVPDLVLMDVTMPKIDGLEATRQIKRELPSVSVVMATIHEDPNYLFEALKAGAAGYLLKDASRAELLGTVRKALDGEFLLNPELATQLLHRLASEEYQKQAGSPPGSSLSQTPEEHQSSPTGERLTPREIEVSKLLAQGLTNRQIAQELVVSMGTAQVHVHHIISKLGVSDRTQAAVRAIKLGLIALDR